LAVGPTLRSREILTAKPVTINSSGSVSREGMLGLTSGAPPMSKCGIAFKPGLSSSDR
jgi:hypothetical protein